MSFHAKRRLASLAVFLTAVLFASLHFSDFLLEDFFTLIASGLMVLYIIWFSDDIANMSILGSSPIIIDKPSPPWLVEFFAWIFLVFILLASIFGP